MIRQRLCQQIVGAVVTTLLFVACGTPAATPTQAFILAISTEEIAGTWMQRSGALYIRFDEDETLREANALDELDSQPFAINSYQFEGTRMVLKEVSVSGVPSCEESIDSFEIRLLESGDIQIVILEDECGHRAGSLAGEYEPVR
ncbi:MAG: hypothetical protein PVJ07_06995 [Anaerolineales bacterium]|jgi:hypothetical protein